MHQQLLNPATGEFKIDNEFAFSNKTTIEELIAHFGEDKLALNDVKNGYSNYSAWNIQIGELYFIFDFNFFKGVMVGVSFILQAKPYDPNASWDDFSEADEIKKGKFIEKWLADQIHIDSNTHAWGKASTSYDFHNLSTSCTMIYAQPK